MKMLKELLSNKRIQMILGGTLLCVIAVIIILSLRSTFANTETGTAIENQIVDGLSFENAKIVTENGISKYTAEIYNDLEKDYSLKYIEVILKNETGETISTIYGYVGETIESNQVKYLDISIDQEITEITTVEYVIHK